MPKINENKLFFSNSKGSRLCGILSAPAQSRIIVVLSHGFSSTKNSPTFCSLAERLADKGIASFRFDFYGSGESEGQHEDITSSEAVDDLRCAISLVQSLGYKKLGLLGSSFGGMASLIVASQVESLSFLALKSPVSNYFDKLALQFSEEKRKEWKDKGYIIYPSAAGGGSRLNYSFFEDATLWDGYAAAAKISIPALIVHGDADRTVPLAQSVKSAGLMKNCKLKVIPGSNHIYSRKEHFEEMLDTLINFIVQFAE